MSLTVLRHTEINNELDTQFNTTLSIQYQLWMVG